MLLFTLRAGPIPVPTPAQKKVSGKSCENRDVAHGPRGRWSHRTTVRGTVMPQAQPHTQGREQCLRGQGSQCAGTGCGWDVYRRPSQARTQQSGQAAGPADMTSAQD